MIYLVYAFFRVCIQWTLELIFISWITLSMTFSTSTFLWYVFVQISVHSNPVATPGESSSGAAAGRGWRAAVLPRSLCCLRVSLGSKVHFKMCLCIDGFEAKLHPGFSVLWGEKKTKKKKNSMPASWELLWRLVFFVTEVTHVSSDLKKVSHAASLLSQCQWRGKDNFGSIQECQAFA